MSGDEALNIAEHKGMVVGGSITYRTVASSHPYSDYFLLSHPACNQFRNFHLCPL